jgi:hypothetical protein
MRHRRRHAVLAAGLALAPTHALLAGRAVYGVALRSSSRAHKSFMSARDDAMAAPRKTELFSSSSSSLAEFSSSGGAAVLQEEQQEQSFEVSTINHYVY